MESRDREKYLEESLVEGRSLIPDNTHVSTVSRLSSTQSNLGGQHLVPTEPSEP